MIPLEFNSNLVLPIPGKKILSIQGITASAVYSGNALGAELLPSLVGDANSVYLLNVYLNFALQSTADSAITQATDYNDVDFGLIVNGTTAPAEKYVSRYLTNLFCKRIVTNIPFPSSPVNISVYAVGYLLGLTDVG